MVVEESNGSWVCWVSHSSVPSTPAQLYLQGWWDLCPKMVSCVSCKEYYSDKFLMKGFSLLFLLTRKQRCLVITQGSFAGSSSKLANQGWCKLACSWAWERQHYELEATWGWLELCSCNIWVSIPARRALENKVLVLTLPKMLDEEKKETRLLFRHS